MPAFQDFGPWSDRRKAELNQKRKKNFIIFGSIALILIISFSIAVVFIIMNMTQKKCSRPVTSTNSSTSSDAAGKALPSTTSIKTVCSKTDYRYLCEKVLKESVGDSKNKSSDPKALIGFSIDAISSELEKVQNKSKLIKSTDPLVSGAVDDCDELFVYAMEDLQRAKQTVDEKDLNQLQNQTHELKNWLSAVVSDQMTCVEGFPQGESKERMRKEVETSRKHTSNALAIVDQMVSLISSFEINDLGFQHRLTEQSSESIENDQLIVTDTGDILPSWVPEEDRRILKERKEKEIEPNVVVAQDGSGKFKTITEALAAMPTIYVGR